MLLVRIVLLPVRLAFRTTGFAAKAGYRTGRLFGYRRLVVFGLGVGVGLLLAPVTGRELRQRLSSALSGSEPPLELVPRAADELEAPTAVADPGIARTADVSGTDLDV